LKRKYVFKEGFARFLEYVFVNHYFPEWDYWNHFLVEIFFVAMAKDSKSSTHAVELQQPNAKSIPHMFDIISYGKGASILRMISSFIGLPAIWESLHLLMIKFQFKSITTEDLWEAISLTTKLDITSIMDCWVKEPNYPLIFVDNRVDEIGNVILTLRQQCVISSSSYCFSIPLLLKTEKSPVQSYFIKTKDYVITLQSSVIGKWIKLNWGHGGFYRICYSKRMWLDIAAGIASRDISLSDCIGLIGDLLFFVQNNYFSDGEVLKALVEACKDIENRFILDSLSQIGMILFSKVPDNS